MYLDNLSPRFFSYYSKPESFSQAMRSEAVPYVNQFESEMLGTFSNQNDLDRIVSLFNTLKNEVDTGGAFKKTRIKLSDNKKFPFSFALASKGLIRVAEYYSKEIADNFPSRFNQSGLAKTDETMVKGVVPTELVKSIKLKNEKSGFYITIDGKDYVLRQQQKGTAKMLELHPWVELVEGDDGMFYTKPSIVDDFSLAFSSTFKKSYLEMPKAGGNARAVDIFLPLDWVNTSPDVRITSAIPLLLAYEFLQKAKIKVRISVLRPIVAKFQRRRNTSSEYSSSIVGIVIKDFTDPMDWNKIANGRANVRLLSSLTEGNAELRKKENGIFSLNAKASHLMYDDEVMLQQEFGRYKNFLYESEKLGKIKTKLVPKPLMITFSTEGLLSETFSKRVVDSKINGNPDYTMKLIESNFHEILDTVDIYYNAKPQEVVRRIWKRFQDLGLPSLDLKNYINRLLGKMYRDYTPKQGQYASSQEEIDKADKDYKMKVSQYAQAFQNIGI